MVNSQLCPGSFHNQSGPGSKTRDFWNRVVMDGTILNSLCLLTHIYESIQPSLSNGTSATYRAVYTVKFEEVVYVLHAFQKKSKQGIVTPKQDIELVEARLKRAKEHYKKQQQGNKDESGQ